MRALASTSLAILLSVSSSVFAATGSVYSKVTTILLDDNAYGGCMAALETPPSSAGGNTCADPWVTFSCTGDFNTKSQGNLKLQSAQLALVTQATFYVGFDDTKKHNGYCFAVRADVYRNE